MLHSKTQILNNVIYGFEFGYPECCIKHFNVRQVNGQLFSEIQSGVNENKKLFGTGFICCPDCNDKYSSEELINNINNNRLHSNKFPIEDFDSIDFEIAYLLNAYKIEKLTNDIISEVEKYIELID